MKEATGELANLLIVVLSVAILVAFFYFTVWPIIDNNFKKQTACDKAVCEGVDTDKDGLVNCVYKKKNGDSIDITCKYKG